MADTPKHSVSVAGIVVDDQDRVLVIQRRDNGQWEPPGGVLEIEETPEQGAIREVFEETGLIVEVEVLSGVYKNMVLGVIALVFRCRPAEGAERLSDETVNFRWVGLDDAAELMSPAYLIRVADAFLSQVQVRSHDGKRLCDAASS